MTKLNAINLVSILYALAAVLPLVGCTGARAPLTSAKPCAPREPFTKPLAPDALNVPAAAKLVALYHAVGTQIYTCAPMPNASNEAGMNDIWTLKAPDATLYAEHQCVAGTHFGGPTWKSVDGSSVVGAKIASANSPNVDSIPILLLKAVSNNGSGILSKVTYVQRLDTQGGIAPNRPCDNLGAELAVPYEANYYFYTAGN